MAPVQASREVPVEPAVAFAFLRDLDHHWRIAGRFVDVLELHGPDGARRGGVVRVRGPLGLRRTVRTRIVEQRAPHAIVGLARSGAATDARVVWRLSPTGGPGTRVELAIEPLRAGAMDRLLLVLGRPWLRRRLAATLRRLAGELAPSEVDVDAHDRGARGAADLHQVAQLVGDEQPAAVRP